MKKSLIFAMSALALATLFVGCKDQQTEVNDELAKEIQLNRETLTQSKMCVAGDLFGTNKTSVLALILASEDVNVAFSETAFSAYSGTGYAFNIVLNSDTTASLADGTYTPDLKETHDLFTYDPDNTYLTIIQGGSATPTYFQDGEIVVKTTGDVTSVTINAITNAGIAVKGSYTGKIAGEPIYFRNEPLEAGSFVIEATSATYEADSYNREDWATDSVYSYYAEYFSSITDLHLWLAELYYSQQDTATALYFDSLAGEFDYYAQTYTGYKEYYTPANAHYFTLTSEAGDQAIIEVDLNRLDTVYTSVIPDGSYYAVSGMNYYLSSNGAGKIWTGGTIVGSTFISALGDDYYIVMSAVSVKMKGTEVEEITVKGLTSQGSTVEISYKKDK